MKAHKIAYITQKLNLTSEEAQVFWPVHNELENKLHELREANRPDKKKDPEAMTDAEVEVAINKYLVHLTTSNEDTWGDGDSLDRERVRDILLDMKEVA